MSMLPVGFWGRFCEGCLTVGRFLKASLHGVAFVGLLIILPVVVFLLAVFWLTLARHYVMRDVEFERHWSFSTILRMILVSLGEICLVILYAILSYAMLGTSAAAIASIVLTISALLFFSRDYA